MAHVVCRPTRREAEEFYHYFAEEMADADGQAYYRRQRGPTVKDATETKFARPLVNRFMRASGQRYDGAYPGTYPLVGTPDDIVADMVQMSELGLAGHLGCVPRLPEGNSLLRAGSAAAASAAGSAPGGMMPGGKMPAYLVVRAEVAEADRRDFDDWYRTEHLPDAKKAFAAQSAWRAWSRTNPSVHYAYYQFADVAAAEAIGSRRQSAH